MSLVRVLEQEAMDTTDDAQAYDRMDHRETNVRFVEDLVAAGPVQGDVLDVGTGSAKIAVLVAQRVPDVELWAVDLSTSMLDLGQANVEMAGLAERIHLWQADAKALPYPDGRFRTVFSNSIVHHIPEPAAMVREAWRVLAPGGLIFFRDLHRPSDEATLARLVDTYAADGDARQRQLFGDSLHAALTLDEVRALVAPLGCNPQTVQVTSDRHWTWTARKP